MANWYRADKTLAAINAAIENDQGGAWRVKQKEFLMSSADAFRPAEDIPFRSHLGASQIGAECARKIWLDYHWVEVPNFDARILRLFNTGHKFEASALAMLAVSGHQIYQVDHDGKQYRISEVNGHFGGSGDGVIVGVRDLPVDELCLLECKTSNDAGFIELAEIGCRAAKPQHFVQIQIYLHKFGLDYCLYMVENKDTSALHMEIIVRDSSIAETYIERARQVIYLFEPPKKISENPSFFKCKMCSYEKRCHYNIAITNTNCRTCKHSEPNSSGIGGWYCKLKHIALNTQMQYNGCSDHKLIPELDK